MLSNLFQNWEIFEFWNTTFDDFEKWVGTFFVGVIKVGIEK